MKPYRRIKSGPSRPHGPGKDIWDKVSTLTPSFVTLILGLLGAYATYSYNERSLDEKREETERTLKQQSFLAQNEIDTRRQQSQDARMLAETQQLEKLFTYVSSRDPQSREFGYSMFAALGKEELALRLIKLKEDKAGISLVRRLSSSSDPTIRAAAEDSLATLVSMSDKLAISKSGRLAEPIVSDLSSRLGLFVAYMARIGFPPPSTRVQIEFLGEEEINAYYASEQNKIMIGPKIAADPHTALVVYAEYAMVAARGRADIENPEYHPIHIAVSDYLAASYLENPKMGPLIAALYGVKDSFIRNLDNSLL